MQELQQRDLQACIVVDEKFWFDKKQERHHAAVRKQCDVLYNPITANNAALRIWRRLRRNPVNPSGLMTLDGVSQAILLHCDLKNAEDRRVLFTFVQHNPRFRKAFYHFVFGKRGGPSPIDALYQLADAENDENNVPLTTDPVMHFSLPVEVPLQVFPKQNGDKCRFVDNVNPLNVLGKIWNDFDNGLAQKIFKEFENDAEFARQLCTEAPNLVREMQTDELIDYAQRQPGIMMAICANPSIDERLSTHMNDQDIKELLAQSWHEHNFTKALFNDIEAITDPRDIIENLNSMPDLRKSVAQGQVTQPELDQLFHLSEEVSQHNITMEAALQGVLPEQQSQLVEDYFQLHQRAAQSHERSIADFFINAVFYFSFHCKDAMERIFSELSRTHLHDDCSKELRYRLYHPNIIRNMSGYWFRHFKHFVAAAGKNDEYLAHLLNHVGNPIRFVSELAKQDNAIFFGPNRCKRSLDWQDSRKHYIVDRLAKIVPVLSAIPGKQTKKALNKLLRMKFPTDNPAKPWVPFLVKLRQQVNGLIDEYALRHVDRDDQLLNLLDDNFSRGKLNLRPDQMPKLLVQHGIDGVQKHNTKFELIIARDSRLWLQYRIATHDYSEKLGRHRSEYPYLWARLELDTATHKTSLVDYLKPEGQKLADYRDGKSTLASYLGRRKLTSHQALLIVTSKKDWKSLDPYERYWPLAFLNRISGRFAWCGEFLRNKSKELADLNPLFRMRLEYDKLKRHKLSPPAKFERYVLQEHLQNKPDRDNNLEDITKRELAQVVTDLARGKEIIQSAAIQNGYDLLLMAQLPDNDPKKAKAGKIYIDEATGVYKVLGPDWRLKSGTLPEGIELDNLVDNLNNVELKAEILKHTSEKGHTFRSSFADQSELVSNIIDCPVRRNEFFAQITSRETYMLAKAVKIPNDERGSVSVLFHSDFVEDLSLEQLLRYMRSESFSLKNYAFKIFKAFPNKFCDLLESEDPVVCDALPWVIPELSDVLVQLVEEQSMLLTPDVLLGFLNIGHGLPGDVLREVFRPNDDSLHNVDHDELNRNAKEMREKNLTDIFIQNPPLVGKLLQADSIPKGQTRDYLKNILLKMQLNGEFLVTLLQHKPKLFHKLMSIKNREGCYDFTYLHPLNEVIGQIDHYETLAMLMESIFNKDPINGFYWLKKCPNDMIPHLLMLPNIGLPCLDVESYQDRDDVIPRNNLNAYNASVLNMVTCNHLYSYVTSPSVYPRKLECLSAFFSRGSQTMFYSLLQQLTADQVNLLVNTPGVFNFDCNNPDVQHPLVAHLTLPSTQCDAATFIKCMSSGNEALKKLMFEVLIHKRDGMARFQLLANVIKLCDAALLNYLSTPRRSAYGNQVGEDNVVESALAHELFIPFLQDPSILEKLLAVPAEIQLKLVSWMTQIPFGTFVFDLAGQAYAGRDNSLVLDFVIKNQSLAVPYLRELRSNAEACENMKDTTLKLLFNLSSYNVDGLFQEICANPLILGKLLKMRQHDKSLRLSLRTHILPLLRWIVINEDQPESRFQHFYGAHSAEFLDPLSDEFNKAITLFFKSTDYNFGLLLLKILRSNVLGRVLVAHLDADRIQILLNAVSDKESLVAKLREEAPAKLDQFLMRYGLLPQNVEMLWKDYSDEQGSFNVAFRYRQNCDEWQRMLSIRRPALGITQKDLVNRLVAATKKISLDLFIQDLYKQAKVVEQFQANPDFAVAVLSDPALHRLSQFRCEDFYELIRTHSRIVAVLFAAEPKADYFAQWLHAAMQTAPDDVKKLIARNEAPSRNPEIKSSWLSMDVLPEYPGSQYVREFEQRCQSVFTANPKDVRGLYKILCEANQHFVFQHPKFLYQAINLSVKNRLYETLRGYLQKHVLGLIRLNNYHVSLTHIPVEYLEIQEVFSAFNQYLAGVFESINEGNESGMANFFHNMMPYLIQLCQIKAPDNLKAKVDSLVVIGFEVCAKLFVKIPGYVTDSRPFAGEARNGFIELLSAATEVIPQQLIEKLSSQPMLTDLVRRALLVCDVAEKSTDMAAAVGRLQLLLLRTYLRADELQHNAINELLWGLQCVSPSASERLLPASKELRQYFVLSSEETQRLAALPLLKSVARCIPGAVPDLDARAQADSSPPVRLSAVTTRVVGGRVPTAKDGKDKDEASQGYDSKQLK